MREWDRQHEWLHSPEERAAVRMEAEQELARVVAALRACVSPFIFVYIQLMSRYYYQFSPVSLESSPSAIMAGMHSFGSVLAIKH
jgi:TRAP-type C4-dicarboxylate transport system permease small subunit